jgi:glycosyltransferase involved in cell wall biosynthesis
MYASLARIVTVSRHGARYLQEQGIDARRMQLSRLGVAPAKQRSVASADGVLRIVSCSSVIELKRVERIAEALRALALRWPQRRFEWTHFGDGPLMPALRARVREAPTNLLSTLAGRVDNSAVRAFYADRPVDLFMLLSRSEGLPVSIQEAMAAGIPVLATEVGGVAEAVDPGGKNGALVPADASIDQVVTALEALLFEPESQARDARREAAWRSWASDFDASRNHARLASTLPALLDD